MQSYLKIRYTNGQVTLWKIIAELEDATRNRRRNLARVNLHGGSCMKTLKSEIDKRYETKHKDERKAVHAVWGTSMNREDFEELNKFLKDNRITKVQLIYTGWETLKEQYKK